MESKCSCKKLKRPRKTKRLLLTSAQRLVKNTELRETLFSRKASILLPSRNTRRV